MTKIVGILNITPDSFSDGNLFNTSSNASKQLTKLILDGADVIDIGAISTRPNAPTLSVDEEIRRFKEVLPGITPLLASNNIEISIDTFHPETIKFLSDHIPISWINDQSGLKDEKLIEIAKELNCKILIMHQLGLPADPNRILSNELNVTHTVKNWLLSKVEYLIANGIRKDKIIIDPGLGFGKSALQSWDLIKTSDEFTGMDYPVLFGHSRKSFLNLVTNASFSERDLESAIISYQLALKGAAYLRVHNVEMTRRILKVHSQICS